MCRAVALLFCITRVRRCLTFFEISGLWRGVYAEKVAWTVSTAENKLAKGVVKLKADQLTSLKVCCRGFLPSSEPWNKC